MTDKHTPHSEEIEAAVLAAIMLDADAIDIALSIVTEDDFYNVKHRHIFSAICELYKESQPVDLLTITNKLRTSQKLDKAGGAYYVSGLTQKVNSGANVEYHSRILQEYGFRRKLISASGKLHHDLFDESNDVFEMLEVNYRDLNQISERLQRKQQSGMIATVKANLEKIERLKNNKQELSGIPTGWASVDRIISGWNPTDLIILAARPGMGKSALAMQAARFAAIEFNKPSVFFSLEMSEEQLVSRLMATEAKIDSFKLRTGRLTDEEFTRLYNTSANLLNDNLIIDDTPSLQLFELKAKCNMLKRKHDIQCIFVDYLQLLESKSKGNSENRTQEISTITRGLKMIAKELGVPVIALSQLSRAVELRPNKRPQLSDLRESGSIEQDADLVMFLYRPEYYGIHEDENGTSTAGMAKLIIDKHRHGGLADIDLRFEAPYTKFTDWNDIPEPFTEELPEHDGGYGDALSNSVSF